MIAHKLRNSAAAARSRYPGEGPPASPSPRTAGTTSNRSTAVPPEYAAPMRRALRVGLVALGAAMAVCGVASLTGGWLGTPPWADRVHTVLSHDREPGQPPPEAWCVEGVRDRPAIGAASGAAGLEGVATRPISTSPLTYPEAPHSG